MLTQAIFMTMLNYYYYFTCFVDDICDYFGVKISMYFAWLGFYTNSMLYPAVIGFLLWILAESDQVHGAYSVTRFAVRGLSFQTLGIFLKITQLSHYMCTDADFFFYFNVMNINILLSCQHVAAAHNADTKLHGIIILSKVILVFFDSQTSQDICCVVFALFNVVWATLFLERWKRREAELAYRWGTLDTPAESLEEPRPQFRVREDC